MEENLNRHTGSLLKCPSRPSTVPESRLIRTGRWTEGCGPCPPGAPWPAGAERPHPQTHEQPCSSDTQCPHLPRSPSPGQRSKQSPPAPEMDAHPLWTTHYTPAIILCCCLHQRNRSILGQLALALIPTGLRDGDSRRLCHHGCPTEAPVAEKEGCPS